MMLKDRILLLAGFVSLSICSIILLSMYVFNGNVQEETLIQNQEVEIGVDSLSGQDLKDFSIIDKSEIKQGCFGMDCIPSIDDPKFETIKEADKWMDGDDLVFGINLNGVQKVYSQRILNSHEIVNDFFDKEPVAITFCPLCGSAIAYKRIVNGEVSEFGVSGKLHNSDLIMYDRNEENYWGQITGKAIVGPAAARGEVLEILPLSVVTWDEWKADYPDSLSLKRPRSESYVYDFYPYGDYEESERLLFEVENNDSRLSRKEVVYGFLVNGNAKAYREEDLKLKEMILDTIAGIEVEVMIGDDGIVKMVEKESGNEHIPIRNFWFAWAAFYPDTELY